ncbi:MAG: 2TM domain-containing protein [Actinomycetota bacterium]
MSTDEDPIRAQARESLKRKQDFWRFVWVWIGVSLILAVIWYFTGAGYFWPGWAIGGMAIAVFFTALNAYGPGKRIITDDDIDAEIAKRTKKS